MCKIINTSFSTGKFPNALKLVQVIPIRRSGFTQDVNHFRPRLLLLLLLLLLSIFNKIIEKRMQMYEFLEVKNILFENQFGFRMQNSTIHALLQITEQIKSSMEDGKFRCGIFIDLKMILTLLIIQFF